jgi:hypothetical protein
MTAEAPPGIQPRDADVASTTDDVRIIVYLNRSEATRHAELYGPLRVDLGESQSIADRLACLTIFVESLERRDGAR